MNDSILRVIDANWNRSREGLRVVEEFFRFIQNDKEAAVYCKNLRHEMTHWMLEQSFISLKMLFRKRDLVRDCFKDEMSPSEALRQSVSCVLFSNVQRVKESLRVLEEYGKIFSPQWALFFQRIRFEWYNFEKIYCADEKFFVKDQKS